MLPNCSGEIPSVRLGRTIKVRREELEEYLQSHNTLPLRRRSSNRSIIALRELSERAPCSLRFLR
jgi:hypothetical protein